ncbi:NADP-dependent 3-hydroxy acid dehydrogenase YdfG [Prauserella shujinwangii]|uniref:NADP-dependent 3-hydroxy acid dehydrogenase YdfG n=1 Tax=Prauserella shujinwangii TaxID=1453103 RepID=A0A2T0M2D3_9PSEU|nr:glucose 1-dehydrogenase [Prauserella shujinwangii]PRX50882.1 NADP-dependent 3-hydroxy acid dehydrogenase YdfG [Prauserella shujinwangii]
MTRHGFRFDGRIALVTGGTSGIGLATARRLLAEGARVVVTGRDPDRLDAAVAELDGGDRVLAVRADVAEPAGPGLLAAAIRDRHGRLDVVVANAGTASFQPLGDVTGGEFARVVDVNVKGVLFTVRAALPLLPDGAAIVLTASWAPHRGVPGAALYAASKAAVRTLAPSLAAELAPRRIRVNAVSPGYIETPAFRAHVSPEARAAAVAAVAAGRLGTPGDVANAIAFLASAEASYVNGQDLLVDGGLTAAVPERRV